MVFLTGLNQEVFYGNNLRRYTVLQSYSMGHSKVEDGLHMVPGPIFD